MVTKAQLVQSVLLLAVLAALTGVACRPQEEQANPPAASDGEGSVAPAVTADDSEPGAEPADEPSDGGQEPSEQGGTAADPAVPGPVTGGSGSSGGGQPTLNMLVRIEVQGYGNIDIRLLPDNAPLTVGVFLDLVDAGFYDNTQVHRVVAGSRFEAGRFDAAGSPLPEQVWAPSEAENGLLNVVGTIATVPDTDDPDSFTSAFAINTADNPAFDLDLTTNFGRTVFGRIEAGLDVAQAVANAAAPDPPVISSISRLASP